MLKNFQVIQGVGTFSSFRPRNKGPRLTKNTIIYADNGYGKSTIATILKSAYLDDPQRIIARKTLTTSQNNIAQEVVILVENGSIVFQNDKWSFNPAEIKPDILVFDQQYVYDNLFIEKVESEHKQCIHKIIIGHEGVQISTNLTEAKAEEKRLKQALEERKKELDTKIKSTDRRDYLTISDSEEPAVIVELREIENKLQISQEKDELSGLIKFSTLLSMGWDFSEVSEAAQTNLQSIHEDARALFNEHIQSHLKKPDTAEVFIRQGLEQLVDNCPFCGQSLESADALIRTYQELFDLAHSQAIETITGLRNTWAKWDPSADIFRVKGVYDQCNVSLQKVDARLALNISNKVPPIDFDGFQQWALDVKGQIVDALSKKEVNLNQEINLQFLIDFEKAKKELNQQIDRANKLYQNAAQSAKEQLEAIDTQSVQDLEKRKGQLSELRKRSSQEEKSWCEEYQQLESDLQAASSRCQELTVQLSSYSEDIFRKYQQGINQVLEQLGVDFRINNLSEQVDKRAKQPYAEFQITINGMSVTIQEKDDSPCFQNTLSEGEKNTLSFAFFITHLRQKGDLSNTIVVFDDPLSSMDDYRRTITANIIRDLSSQTKQMIVLTHKRDFMLLLSEKLESAQGLSLKKDNANGSTIIPFDIENERKGEQQKRIEKLIRYQDEDFCEANSIQGDIRLCLEASLKFKYFRYLNGAYTLGNICDVFQEQNKLPEDLLHDLRDLNDISSPVHHGGHDMDPIREMDRSELLPYVRKTLDVLERI
jgi:wobble nucleotide-excising tRNase